MARRTKQEADETREALLNAAERVFLKRGVARASLDEVARVAGCTRGAVHWHFGDKLGLFLALDERLFLFQDELRQALMADGECMKLSRFAEVILVCIARLEHDEGRRRLLTVMWQRCEYVDEMAPALERRRRADVAISDVFRQCFEQAMERGELAPYWQPSQAALFLHALMVGFLTEWLRSDAAFSLSDQVRGGLKMFFSCLSGIPPSNAQPTVFATA
ncbi:MAG: hypothetical protein JWP20_1522 [Roseomonas sp.]|jgi:AcrR family transcriptional regulator|nr:hypothetical protein [Roseomonas sp.]